MKSNINISDVADVKITEMISESYRWINQITEDLPMGEMVPIIYAKIMGVVEIAIDKFGIIGISLASKSVSFVIDAVKDGIKTVKMKKELEELENKFHETYEFESNYRRK